MTWESDSLAISCISELFLSLLLVSSIVCPTMIEGYLLLDVLYHPLGSLHNVR